MPERKVSLALSMGSAMLYAAVAVAMGFANKATLQVFGHANTLLLLQMCAVIIVVGTLRVTPLPAPSRPHQGPCALRCQSSRQDVACQSSCHQSAFCTQQRQSYYVNS